jgi:hypothetical protein
MVNINNSNNNKCLQSLDGVGNIYQTTRHNVLFGQNMKKTDLPNKFPAASVFP